MPPAHSPKSHKNAPFVFGRNNNVWQKIGKFRPDGGKWIFWQLRDFGCTTSGMSTDGRTGARHARTGGQTGVNLYLHLIYSFILLLNLIYLSKIDLICLFREKIFQYFNGFIFKIYYMFPLFLSFHLVICVKLLMGYLSILGNYLYIN